MLCFVRQSAFRLPPSLATPLVCFGPGTGLAPFRAFVQARSDAIGAEAEELESPRAAAGPKAAPMALYFGCRHLAKEYLYEAELRDAEAAGVVHIAVASSRDNATAPHRYVQDLLVRPEDAGATRKALLHDGAHLYVCGDAKRMAADVHRALVGVLAEELRDDAAAEEWLANAAKSGRYQRDVW